MANFYMYEMIDKGAGAVSSGASNVFVFNDADSLLAHFDEAMISTEGTIEGEEATTDFVNRLGVDSHHLWVVRDDVVVGWLDFDTLFEVRASSGQHAMLDRPDEVNTLVKRSEGPIQLIFDKDALRVAVPTTTSPLAPDTWVSLRWAVDKKDSLLDDSVKLGFAEINGN